MRRSSFFRAACLVLLDVVVVVGGDVGVSSSGKPLLCGASGSGGERGGISSPGHVGGDVFGVRCSYEQLWDDRVTGVTDCGGSFLVALSGSKRDLADCEDDIRVIKQRLLKAVMKGNGDFADVGRLLESLRRDGSWGDLNYADRSRARWEPAVHLKRLVRMALAYAHPRSPHRGDAGLKEGILRAFDCWIRRRPRCPNWWYNVIGVPRYMYKFMLLMEDHLSPEWFEAGVGVLKQSGFGGMTGQNLASVAEINIARGCLVNDAALVRLAFRKVAGEIRITTGEGIQPDFSFYQHGAQLQSGSYGRLFIVQCARFARLAHGTVFALPLEKVKILSRYLLDGEQWMIRGPTFDYSVCGRSITRPMGCRSSTLIGACKDMLQIDPPRRKEIEAFLARLEKPLVTSDFSGNKHFWRADYMAHHRPAFMASVRMTSNRTIQTEVVNAENLLGAHLSDGVMYLYRRGDEYLNLFPVWDWKKLPGVTVELDGKPPLTPRRRQRGKRSFVGGVSDGMYGLAVMDFARGKLVARKAWYFSDRAILCLGCGITCSSGYPVITTVNQCRLRGGVFVASMGGSFRPLSAGRQVVEGPAWVFHDGVGYVFPRKSTLVVCVAKQRGSWWRINRAYSKKEVVEDVFSLWIEHGSRVADATYEYVVLPGVAKERVSDHASHLPVHAIRNSPAVQAVWDEESRTLAVAFYKAGVVATAKGLRLSVDKPCLVLLRETRNKWILALSNPENKPLQVTVEVNRKLAGSRCVWCPDSGVTRISCRLPGGMYAGKSVVVQLSP